MISIKLKNAPNFLSLSRIGLIPILVLCYYLPYGYISATIIFILAAITDYLDGFLARSFNLNSSFGAFIDPVADKLLVTITLIILIPRLKYIVLATIIIVGREIIVSALREWMANLGKRASLAVTYISKIKTATQMFALIGLLFCSNNNNVYYWLIILSYVLLYVAAILTIWSMYCYLKIANNKIN